MTKRKAYHITAGNLNNLKLIEENLSDPKADKNVNLLFIKKPLRS